jgi:hypothetical protein
VPLGAGAVGAREGIGGGTAGLVVWVGSSRRPWRRVPAGPASGRRARAATCLRWRPHRKSRLSPPAGSRYRTAKIPRHTYLAGSSGYSATSPRHRSRGNGTGSTGFRSRRFRQAAGGRTGQPCMGTSSGGRVRRGRDPGPVTGGRRPEVASSALPPRLGRVRTAALDTPVSRAVSSHAVRASRQVPAARRGATARPQGWGRPPPPASAGRCRPKTYAPWTASPASPRSPCGEGDRDHAPRRDGAGKGRRFRAADRAAGGGIAGDRAAEGGGVRSSGFGLAHRSRGVGRQTHTRPASYGPSPGRRPTVPHGGPVAIAGQARTRRPAGRPSA